MRIFRDRVFWILILLGVFSELIPPEDSIEFKFANILNHSQFQQRVERPEAFVHNAYVLLENTKMPTKRRKQNLLTAVDECNRALREKSDYARAYAARASVKLELGSRDEALKDINVALQLEPKNAIRYIARSYILGMQTADLDKAIEIEPTNSLAHLFRANSKMMDKDYLGATFDYAKAFFLGKDLNYCFRSIRLYSHCTREDELKSHSSV